MSQKRKLKKNAEPSEPHLPYLCTTRYKLVGSIVKGFFHESFSPSP